MAPAPRVASGRTGMLFLPIVRMQLGTCEDWTLLPDTAGGEGKTWKLNSGSSNTAPRSTRYALQQALLMISDDYDEFCRGGRMSERTYKQKLLAVEPTYHNWRRELGKRGPIYQIVKMPQRPLSEQLCHHKKYRSLCPECSDLR